MQMSQWLDRDRITMKLKWPYLVITILNQNIPKNHVEFPGSPLRDFTTAGGKIAFPCLPSSHKHPRWSLILSRQAWETLDNSKEMCLESKNYFNLECKYLVFTVLGGDKKQAATCESTIFFFLMYIPKTEGQTIQQDGRTRFGGVPGFLSLGSLFHGE